MPASAYLLCLDKQMTCFKTFEQRWIAAVWSLYQEGNGRYLLLDWLECVRHCCGARSNFLCSRRRVTDVPQNGTNCNEWPWVLKEYLWKYASDLDKSASVNIPGITWLCIPAAVFRSLHWWWYKCGFTCISLCFFWFHFKPSLGS